MKSFVVLSVILVAGIVGKCNGQTAPLVWGREQRDQRSRSNSQEASNELIINTDRLMSSLESRLSSLFRSEINDLRQEISRVVQANTRLENVVNSVKSDVAGLKTALDTIRDQFDQGQDLSQDQSPRGDSQLIKKLDNFHLLLSAVRGTVGKIERDMLVVKKTVRTINAYRRGQPQVALIQQDVSDNEIEGVCTPIDKSLGVKQIRKNFYAPCDEETGWILIQSRFDGSTDFFRPWTDYRDGFGNIAGEFWMGLEKIYELTSSKIHQLKIEMESFSGEKKTAKYSAFGISGESSAYALSLLGSYSGDAGDSLSYHAGMKFSTFDNDNDGWSDGNCARSHQGAFWYNSCDETNLNGKYFEDGKVEESQNYQGIYWGRMTGSLASLKSVRIMIRPIDD